MRLRWPWDPGREPVPPVDREARMARICVLIAADVDDDALDGAIAAATDDERADALALLGLANDLALDYLGLIRMRQAFLIAGQEYSDG